MGDRLVIEGLWPDSGRRVGVVTGAGMPDGRPPYRVYWLDNGCTTLLVPGPRGHIEPAATTAR